MTVKRCFRFENHREFKAGCLAIVQAWLPQLAGHSFQIRLNELRSGPSLLARTSDQEIANAALETLHQAGKVGYLDYKDPDVVIQIDVIHNHATVSLHSSADIATHSASGLLGAQPH